VNLPERNKFSDKLLLSENTYSPDFNWRNHDGKNWITSIKNQGACGSCWAFSALGIVEAGVNINLNDNGYNIDLSEQDLVSCSNAGDCNGGQESDALLHIQNNGIVQESCFGYTTSNSACSKCANWNNELTKINYAGISATPEAIKSAIENNGPVTVYMTVCGDFNGFSGDGIYSHSGNVFSDASCWTIEGNTWYFNGHTINIVGYSDSGQYWIGKNSWGSGWGDGGFIKIAYSESVYDFDAWWESRLGNGDSRTFFFDDSYVVTSTDVDNDGTGDSSDNCPKDVNPDQSDGDSDGFGAECDCNDSNAEINPESTEVCDGIDNDCDGLVDEDENGDSLIQQCGSGNCQGSQTCTNGQWSSCDSDGTVCDDGQYCTVNDQCTTGVCNGGAKDCSDGVDCTNDICNELTDSCDNTPNDGFCDNGFFCDGAETCDSVNNCQVGISPIVNDGIGCTDDWCDEFNDVIVNDPINANCDDGVGCTNDVCDATTDCQYSANDANCNDGLFCNGQETCDLVNDCQDGTTVICSANDLPEIGICDNDPDNNPFTWDYADEFESTCDEDKDQCTTTQYDYTHECSTQVCGAECESDGDCEETDCDFVDDCYDGTYRDYANADNTCEDCACTDNSCAVYNEIITDIDGDDYDTECDSDCNNNDATIYPGAPEIACDGIDQDCNGVDYCGCSDIDGDGYNGTDAQECPIGLDCNDNDDSIHPNAEEILCDSIDQDCDGSDNVGTDNDNDTFKIEGDLCGIIDCNDNDATTYPGAPEIDDNIDQNCQNDAPVLGNINNIIVNETDTATITASALDTDGDNMYYWINDSRFSKNGVIFTWPTPDASTGVYDVLVSVCDLEPQRGSVRGTVAINCVLNDTQSVVVTVNDACTPNWYCSNYSTCQTNDRKECNQENDTNNCYAQTNLVSDQYSGDLSEFIGFCDYDNNGIIGKENETTTNIENLSISIENSTNLTQNFTNKLKVEFKENNITIVEFELNFSESKLNLANITIEKQESNATNGGIIISGIDLTAHGETKTVYVDRLSSEDYVCVKDEELASIDELPPADCSSGTAVFCPGSNGVYTCSLANNNTQFKVEGLSHSGITESTYSPPSISGNNNGGGGGGGGSSCKPNYVCQAISSCSSHGKQTEICTDAECNKGAYRQTVSCTYIPPKVVTTTQEPEEEIEEELPEVEPPEETSPEQSGMMTITGAAIGTAYQEKPLTMGGLTVFILLIIGLFIYSHTRNLKHWPFHFKHPKKWLVGLVIVIWIMFILLFVHFVLLSYFR
jgi:hypothetical protein